MASSTPFSLIPKNIGKAGSSTALIPLNLNFSRAVSIPSCSLRRDARPLFGKNLAPLTARFVCFTLAGYRGRKTSTFWQMPTADYAMTAFRCSFLSLVMAHTPRRWRNRCHRQFLPATSQGKELATAYASADIFVFPSTTDTFGNVILEAQACGVPVIVSDSGGPKELVEDRTNGLITRSRDVDDFTRAIRSLATDAALRERMGTAARKSVVDRAGQTRSASSGPRPISRRQLHHRR